MKKFEKISGYLVYSKHQVKILHNSQNPITFAVYGNDSFLLKDGQVEKRNEGDKVYYIGSVYQSSKEAALKAMHLVERVITPQMELQMHVVMNNQDEGEMRMLTFLKGCEQIGKMEFEKRGKAKSKKGGGK